jgi:tetratricopeptide (TPR) repeat protein
MAVTLDANSAQAWEARGDAYFLLGRFQEALADLEKARQLEPENKEVAALADQARAKVEAADHEQKAAAEEAARQAAAAKQTVAQTEPLPVAPQPAAPPVAGPAPQSAPSRTPARPAPAVPPPATAPLPKASEAADHHARGRQLIQQNKFQEAIQELTLALRAAPEAPLVYNARGFAFLQLKRYKEAIADFDQAIKLNPGYQNAYTNRAAARRAAGDAQGAAEDQAKARALFDKGGNRN